MAPITSLQLRVCVCVCVCVCVYVLCVCKAERERYAGYDFSCWRKSLIVYCKCKTRRENSVRTREDWIKLDIRRKVTKKQSNSAQSECAAVYVWISRVHDDKFLAFTITFQIFQRGKWRLRVAPRIVNQSVASGKLRVARASNNDLKEGALESLRSIERRENNELFAVNDRTRLLSGARHIENFGDVPRNRAIIFLIGPAYRSLSPRACL